MPVRTPLQRATLAHAELVRLWRDTLTADEYRAFVATALSLLACEAARLDLGDLLRTLRFEGDS